MPDPRRQLPPNVSLIQMTFDKITRQFNIARLGPCAEDRGEVYLMLGMAFETLIVERIRQDDNRTVNPAIMSPQGSPVMSG